MFDFGFFSLIKTFVIANEERVKQSRRYAYDDVIKKKAQTRRGGFSAVRRIAMT
jgi:hypothetical protein